MELSPLIISAQQPTEPTEPTHTCYPDDWPTTGRLDLQVHDLPHESSTMEWWYVNAHVSSPEGREFSLFAAFFRMAREKDEQTGLYNYSHVVTWAISDPEKKIYIRDSLLDPSAPEMGLKMLNQGNCTTDKLVKQALKEVFQKGKVPLPDRLLPEPAEVSKEKLYLGYGTNVFKKLDNDSSYQLTLLNDTTGAGCELTFTPNIEPVTHGDNGVVKGDGLEDMFYYFIPQCKVTGKINIDSKESYQVQGNGWYDHEFGRSIEKSDNTAEAGLRPEMAWNWLSLQLNNGWQISGYEMFDNRDNRAGAGSRTIIIDPQGKSRNLENFILSPLKSYTSSRTFIEYPVEWHLQIPDFGADFIVKATFPDQEFITSISSPAFWEGRVEATGTFDQQEVKGLGFVERSGFATTEKFEDFLKAVTKETKKSIQALIPLNPSDDAFIKMVGSHKNSHFVDGLDKEQYINSAILPIREIIDRGGKSWRSYVPLACMDVVGGNSQSFMDWLALSELLHAGTLIVDDVEDRSLIRRGGPSCHVVHGEAIAINSGNLAYFLAQMVLTEDRVSDKVKLKAYELYFETMRAGHAGQAVDIAGFHGLMPYFIEKDDSTELEKRVLAVHRLKSAVAPSMLAQIGATQGGGTQAQIDGIGKFFESLGLAFQIIDDVLNLRGFENNLKDRGEDITSGKITLPVAKAMSRLGLDDRKWLWEKLSGKPQDRETIDAVIGKLEECGAIEACQKQAEELVESAWEKVDPLIPDSEAKIKIRIFSWYLLKRHY